MTKPSWHILGAGSIGCLWAYKLASAGLNVSLIFRSAAKAENFSQKGLTVIEGHKTLHVNVPATTVERLQSQSIERVIVATKSWQCISALNAVKNALVENAEVVLLQNGYGQLQQAKPLLLAQRCYVASTTDGAFLSDQTTLNIAGLDKTLIGPYNDKATVAPSSLPFTEPVNDIEAILWRKLCINAVINPLTAIHNVQNGELLKAPAIMHTIDLLSAELALITQASGHIFLDQKTIHQAVCDVAKATANNSSSMRQDVLLGKQTEAEEIIGFLIKTALQKHIETPSLTELESLLLKKQSALQQSPH